MTAASFRERLGRREPLAGTLLSLPSPEIAEICCESGFDWLFLDMEHGLLDCAAAQRMIQAVAGRCACLVRVPENTPYWAGRVLDLGADGVIFPHINNPEAARASVRDARYSPGGTRSIGPARAQGYGLRILEALESANRDTALVLQAEHIDAVRNIGGILDVPGFDAVFIGPFDLSASMGKPGMIADPEVREAIAGVKAACAERGVPTGILAANPEGARRAFEEGHSLVCVATDTLLFGAAARAAAKQALSKS